VNQITLPRLTPEQVQRVSALASEYITLQRERFSPRAAPLAARQRATLAGFFDPKLLDAVHVLALKRARLRNPPFYATLADMGFSGLPNFSQMAAVTFATCSCFRRRWQTASCSTNSSTSSSTGSLGLSASPNSTSGDSSRAVAMMEYPWRSMPASLAAGLRWTLGSPSSWPTKWRDGSERRGSEQHANRADVSHSYPLDRPVHLTVARLGVARHAPCLAPPV
jgi:hypothetical protein